MTVVGEKRFIYGHPNLANDTLRFVSRVKNETRVFVLCTQQDLSAMFAALHNARGILDSDEYVLVYPRMREIGDVYHTSVTPEMSLERRLIETHKLIPQYMQMAVHRLVIVQMEQRPSDDAVKLRRTVSQAMRQSPWSVYSTDASTVCCCLTFYCELPRHASSTICTTRRSRTRDSCNWVWSAAST